MTEGALPKFKFIRNRPGNIRLAAGYVPEKVKRSVGYFVTKIDKKPILVGTQQRFIRRGKCNRCGWCCEHEDCPNYSKDPETGIATCAIHGSPDRPRKCLDFPQAPPILHEGCGYRFYDLWFKKWLGVKEVE